MATIHASLSMSLWNCDRLPVGTGVNLVSQRLSTNPRQGEHDETPQQGRQPKPHNRAYGRSQSVRISNLVSRDLSYGVQLGSGLGCRLCRRPRLSSAKARFPIDCGYVSVFRVCFVGIRAPPVQVDSFWLDGRHVSLLA